MKDIILTKLIDCANKNKNQGLKNELGQVEYKNQYREIKKNQIAEQTYQYRKDNADKIKRQGNT